MKIFKQLICITLIVIMSSSFSTTCFAHIQKNGQMYTFTFKSGKTVNYYLDENNMPYLIENGNKVPIALPLEHLKISSSDLTDSTISSYYTTSTPIEIHREPPNNTFSLKNGSETKSNVYSANASFSNSIPFYSRDFELEKKHNAMRVKTTNIKKPLLGSNYISFVYRYYEVYSKQRYSINVNDVKCTATNGFSFQHMPTEFPFGQIVILIPKDITACTVNIWTTTAY